jgi:divalent metal cation (Fe/Co/Zn/Cd) transporter
MVSMTESAMEVSAAFGVLEAHEFPREVERRLLHRFAHLDDVSVHVEPAAAVL